MLLWSDVEASAESLLSSVGALVGAGHGAGSSGSSGLASSTSLSSCASGSGLAATPWRHCGAVWQRRGQAVLSEAPRQRESRDRPPVAAATRHSSSAAASDQAWRELCRAMPKVLSFPLLLCLLCSPALSTLDERLLAGVQ
ncbi:UNVERIFIED_CONTAM: hypothetical protein K2H54_065865 [Gekko kuhli]